MRNSGRAEEREADDLEAERKEDEMR